MYSIPRLVFRLKTFGNGDTRNEFLPHAGSPHIHQPSMDCEEPQKPSNSRGLYLWGTPQHNTMCIFIIHVPEPAGDHQSALLISQRTIPGVPFPVFQPIRKPGLASMEILTRCLAALFQPFIRFKIKPLDPNGTLY